MATFHAKDYVPKKLLVVVFINGNLELAESNLLHFDLLNLHLIDEYQAANVNFVRTMMFACVSM